MRYIASWFFVATLVLFTFSVNGEETDKEGNSAEPRSFGVITVTARKSKKNLFMHPTMESAGLGISTSIVGTNDILRQNPTTLTETMEYNPGILTETRGRKIKQFSSFRGQRYPYPDYAINGIRQAEFHDIPYFFPASQIEAVEIIRSSAALMMGLSKPVGVINIIPKRFDVPGNYAELEYGTYDTFRGYMSHNGGLQNGSYKMGLGHFSTAGPEDENAAEQMTSLNVLTAGQAGKDLYLEGNLFWLYGMRELRRAKKPARKRLQTTEEKFDPYNSAIANLRGVYTETDNASTEFQLNYAARMHDFENPGSTGLLNHDDDDYEYGVSVIQVLSPANQNILRVGTLYHHWVAPDGKRFYVGNKMDLHTVSGVIVDEHYFERMVVNAGLRYVQRYMSDYGGYTFDTSGQRYGLSEPVKDEWEDPVIRGTLGAKYEIQKGLNCYFNLGGDMIQPPPGSVDENLQEPGIETRSTVDLGIKAEIPGVCKASLGTFCSLRADAILLSGDIMTNAIGEEVDLYDNRDLTQYGVEMEARTARIIDLFSVFINATIMDSIAKIDGDWESYKDLPDIILSSGLYMDLNRFDCNLFGKYVSSYENKRFAADGQYHSLGDYVGLNLTAGYHMGAGRNTRLYASVKNLTDNEYSTVVGYPDYGRRFSVGIQHRF